MNLYASYAKTTVDIADINHIVWENNGQLFHAIYDQNPGTWNQAKFITNTQGGENLKLLATRITPYIAKLVGLPLYLPVDRQFR